MDRITSNSPEFKKFIANKYRDGIWRDKQAKWCLPDLRAAIRSFCNDCNGEENWLETNDCVSAHCPLFPFRPGRQRDLVESDGMTFRRAVKFSRGDSTRFVVADGPTIGARGSKAGRKASK